MGLIEQRRLADTVRKFVTAGERKRLKTLDRIRIEGRFPDGTLALRSLIHGECVYRGQVAQGYEGQIVETEPSGPLNISGAAGASLLSVGRLGATLELESLEPHFYLAGATYAVTGTGFGFGASFAIEFGIRDSEGEIDPDMTIENLTVVDEHTFTMDVTRAPGALPLDAETAPVYFDNVGAPP